MRDLLSLLNAKMVRGKCLALCPFHNEKSPSFSIRETELGLVYFCFSCGVKGNHVDLCRHFGIDIEIKRYERALLPISAEEVFRIIKESWNEVFFFQVCVHRFLFNFGHLGGIVQTILPELARPNFREEMVQVMIEEKSKKLVLVHDDVPKVFHSSVAMLMQETGRSKAEVLRVSHKELLLFVLEKRDDEEIKEYWVFGENGQIPSSGVHQYFGGKRIIFLPSVESIIKGKFSKEFKQAVSRIKRGKNE